MHDLHRPPGAVPFAPQFQLNAWREFVNGLVSPSPTAIGIALSLNAVVLLGLSLLVTPALVGGASRTRLALHAEDYDAVVTSQVHALTYATQVRPAIVLFGGSTMRASLLERDLERLARLAGGVPQVVHKLCTSRQTLWETLALVEQLPERMSGVAAIGVGPSLFSTGDEALDALAEAPRLGIRSTSLDAAIAHRGRPVRAPTGIYAFDNAAFLMARKGMLARALIGRPAAPYVDSVYQREATPVSEAAWAARGGRVASRLVDVKQNWRANAVLLERVIAQLRRRTDLQVVLVETPVNPRFTEHFDRGQVARWHTEQMREFARAQDVPYLVLNDEARLAPTDFFDWAHLRDRDAARRCAAAFIAAIRGRAAQ